MCVGVFAYVCICVHTYVHRMYEALEEAEEGTRSLELELEEIPHLQ